MNQPSDPTLPEPLKRFLEAGGQPESIRLDGEGRWFHQGEPFTNGKIIRFFNRILTRTDGGTWLLKTGDYAFPVQVEDTGFFVDALRVSRAGAVVTISDETEEPLHLPSVTYRPVGRLYCQIKARRYRARFRRAAYNTAAEYMIEEQGRVYLAMGGQRVFLAGLEDDPP